MGVVLKSVNVKTKKYHVWQGERELDSVYSVPEDAAKKLVALGKVEYANEKPIKETPKLKEE